VIDEEVVRKRHLRAASVGLLNPAGQDVEHFDSMKYISQLEGMSNNSKFVAAHEIVLSITHQKIIR